MFVAVWWVVVTVDLICAALHQKGLCDQLGGIVFIGVVRAAVKERLAWIKRTKPYPRCPRASLWLNTIRYNRQNTHKGGWNWPWDSAHKFGWCASRWNPTLFAQRLGTGWRLLHTFKTRSILATRLRQNAHVEQCNACLGGRPCCWGGTASSPRSGARAGPDCCPRWIKRWSQSPWTTGDGSVAIVDVAIGFSLCWLVLYMCVPTWWDALISDASTSYRGEVSLMCRLPGTFFTLSIPLTLQPSPPSAAALPPPLVEASGDSDNHWTCLEQRWCVTSFMRQGVAGTSSCAAPYVFCPLGAGHLWPLIKKSMNGVSIVSLNRYRC